MRCDNKQPDCSRCLSKGVRCQYLANRTTNTGPTRQYCDHGTTPVRMGVPLVVAEHPNAGDDRELRNMVDVPFDASCGILDFCPTEFGGGGLDPEIDFTSFWSPQMNKDSAPLNSRDSWSLTSPLIPAANQQDQEQQLVCSPDRSIPPIPSTTIRSFHRRPTLNSNAKRITALILANLKSYPLMMLRDNTLPPFIHPYLTSPNSAIEDMEPLTNCISLVQMLSSRLNGSRKLFWRNVRVECERICADHQQLNKWELFAAMQALSIYILIRLDVGETEHNDFDGLLVSAVIVAATQFNSVYAGSASDTQVTTRASSNLETCWKEWILVESARRLCVVYQVVNMLIYFEPAAMCEVHGTDLLLAPLPAKKQLWEADNEVAWKAESGGEYGGLSTAYGLAANGDLVRVDDGSVGCGENSVLRSDEVSVRRVEGSTVEWEEWCAGMDGLGGLVMLAASLVAA